MAKGKGQNPNGLQLAERRMVIFHNPSGRPFAI
jgi:hypothetical protein